MQREGQPPSESNSQGSLPMEEVKFFQDPTIEYELLRRKMKVLWIEVLV